MRLLLDTHAFLWWLDGDRRLPASARSLIGDDATIVHVSAASAWEVATKVRKGKLPGAVDVAADIVGIVASHGFTPLAVTMAHAQRAGAIVGSVRDPFDQMLIAQALIESLPLVSNETAFDAYGISRVWD